MVYSLWIYIFLDWLSCLLYFIEDFLHGFYHDLNLFVHFMYMSFEFIFTTFSPFSYLYDDNSYYIISPQAFSRSQINVVEQYTPSLQVLIHTLQCNSHVSLNWKEGGILCHNDDDSYLILIFYTRWYHNNIDRRIIIWV